MPKEKKMKVVISVNPYDFLTMSFGRGWASCQTIDKTNLRNNGNDNYQGCYSGGTVDLAEDESTIIMYLIPDNYDGVTPYKEDKIKRCLFYMGEDKFVQSRVYPDGRDGTDYTDISKQMCNAMYKFIEETEEELKDNWVRQSKEDVSMRNFVASASGKLHYADYFQYSDSCLVTNKKVGLQSSKKIIIGSQPTCLCCGGPNDYEG